MKSQIKRGVLLGIAAFVFVAILGIGLTARTVLADTGETPTVEAPALENEEIERASPNDTIPAAPAASKAVLHVPENGPAAPAETTGTTQEVLNPPANEPSDPAEEVGEPEDENSDPAEEVGEPEDENSDPAEEVGEPEDENSDPAEVTGAPADGKNSEDPVDPDAEPAANDSLKPKESLTKAPAKAPANAPAKTPLAEGEYAFQIIKADGTAPEELRTNSIKEAFKMADEQGESTLDKPATIKQVKDAVINRAEMVDNRGECDTYTPQNAGTHYFSVHSGKNVVLDGAGYQLNLINDEFMYFLAVLTVESGGNLKISNVNCNGNYGSFQLSAFLVNYGNSTIEDCNFSNKSSFTFADNHTGMLTIQNTNFSNWEEYGHGGLICTQANLNIDGCIFDNTWDGASWGVVEIRNLSSDDPMVEVNIHNTTFEDPKHSGFGSPYIFNDGNYGFVNISLDNVAFQNIHDGYESLILSYGNGRTDIHLKNTSFENVTTNKASCSLLSNHYGNVYIDGQVTITNCSGGSLWWSSDIITADDARLIVENCESSAGIIRIVADSRLPQASKVNGVTVQNCRTTYPEETYSGNTYGSGGAFYVASGYGCEFSDICVRNNFAEGYGGGIYIPVSRDGNAKITFTNCEIYNNEAGIAGSDIYAEANNKYPISIEAASIGAPLTTDFSGCTDAVTGWFDDSEGSRWQAHAEDPAGNYTERVEPQTFEPGSGVPLALKAAHGNYTLTYQTNGGTWADGSDADVSEVFADGNAATILEAPTREGYEFVEWKGSSYQPGDLYNEKSEDGLTFISDVLVAQWKKIEPKQDPTPTPASTPTKPQNVETIVQSANPAPALSSPAKTIAGNVTTGDETNVMPWILLLAAASACGAAIVASDRRKAGK